ncbi:hypothetical protein C8Q74DRAFT_661064 [Fomes fomentarius]|nr:hypothetical protein C8Q74DRAFT_661064 [Fomes fomentarius]
MWIWEWVQTGLVTDFAFDNFVYGYGQPQELVAFHNTWFSVTIMCALLSAVVQCYFAYRIWVLGKSKVLTGAIVFLSIAQMCVGVTGGALLKNFDPTAAEASLVTPVISAWLSGAAFVDIIIAVSMTILLLRAKTGIRKSDNMVNKLVTLVVETGTLTATVAIVDVICFTAYSDTLLHECPAVVLAKLYANTFVASLNNRALMKISNMVNGSSFTSSDITSSFQLGNIRNRPNDSVRNVGAALRGQVQVTDETVVAHDLGLRKGKASTISLTEAQTESKEDGIFVA